jgi:hypothetical protein
MSRLAIDDCGNALQALQSLFRSDRFSEHDIATSSAMLSQKGTPVEKQNDIMVLTYMLNEWGIGLNNAISNDDTGAKTWMFDSITFLTKNPCIIGFIIRHGANNWRAVKRLDEVWEWQKNKIEWERIERHSIIDKIMRFDAPCFILWKQWVPLRQWIKDDRPFYIRSTDTETNSRWEYEPTSCWLPQKMIYLGKNKRIAKILRRWDSPCLISNAKQFIHLKPANQGWEQETIMEFDGLPIGTVGDRLADLVQTKIEAHINNHPNTKQEIMPYVAHALMSVASKFGININHKQLSAFQMDGDEVEKLRAYDEQLSKIE